MSKNELGFIKLAFSELACELRFNAIRWLYLTLDLGF